MFVQIKQFDINFNRFQYIIEDTGVKLIKRRFSSSTETFVEFESIGSKIIKENTRKLYWAILSVLFLLIAIAVFVSRMKGGKVGDGAEFFHLSVSFVLLMIFFLTKKRTLFLAQQDNINAIEFIASNRNKGEVEAFIKILLKTRDEYLIKKYAQIDEFLPYDQQYNDLVWLYNLKLLSKVQLKTKLEELEKVLNSINIPKTKLTKIIGFKTADLDDIDEKIEE